MPSITFQLSGPCHQYNSSVDEDDYSMSVEGKCVETWHRKYFTIFKDGVEFNGFEGYASISFRQRVARSEKLGIPVDEPFNRDDPDRDAISVNIYSNEVFFNISISLPPDSFERLKNTNWAFERVELTVNNGLFGQPRFPRGEGALISGPDPDGYEIEWHVDRQSYQFIEDFYIRFFPIAHENLEFPILKNFIDEKISLALSNFDKKIDHFVESNSRINLSVYDVSTSIYRCALALIASIFMATACILVFG